jgi:hypothetical protein
LNLISCLFKATLQFTQTSGWVELQNEIKVSITNLILHANNKLFWKLRIMSVNGFKF